MPPKFYWYLRLALVIFTLVSVVACGSKPVRSHKLRYVEDPEHNVVCYKFDDRSGISCVFVPYTTSIKDIYLDDERDRD